jgi:hypothetical protein
MPGARCPAMCLLTILTQGNLPVNNFLVVSKETSRILNAIANAIIYYGIAAFPTPLQYFLRRGHPTLISPEPTKTDQLYSEILFVGTSLTASIDFSVDVLPSNSWLLPALSSGWLPCRSFNCCFSCFFSALRSLHDFRPG